MMIKLKPCSFCGSKGQHNEAKTMAHCANWGCSMQWIWIPIKEWNSRPIEDQLKDEKDELLEFVMYADHDSGCSYPYGEEYGCKCGLKDLQNKFQEYCEGHIVEKPEKGETEWA